MVSDNSDAPKPDRSVPARQPRVAAQRVVALGQAILLDNHDPLRRSAQVLAGQHLRVVAADPLYARFDPALAACGRAWVVGAGNGMH